LHQAHLKADPLWTWQPSIETIKRSPEKSTPEQTRDTSCFFTLETIGRGSLFDHSSDKNSPLFSRYASGYHRSLVSMVITGSASSSVSPRVPPPLSSFSNCSGRRRGRRVTNLRKLHDTDSCFDFSSNDAGETKESANNNAAKRSHTSTVSRYEKLRSERRKIRDKISQIRVERQDLVPSDTNTASRKISAFPNVEAATRTSLTKASKISDSNHEVRLNAAIVIQSSIRSFFASKVLRAKKAAALAESKWYERYSSSVQKRTARVNTILEKIKTRELRHRPFQHGYLYTIHEEEWFVELRQAALVWCVHFVSCNVW